MSGSLRDEFRFASLGFSFPEPGVFVQCQWRCPRWLYTVWRGLWLLWHVAILVASAVNFQEHIASSSKDGAKWLIYYPHITFILTGVTCLVDFINVLRVPRSQLGEKGTHLSSSKDKDEILFRGEFIVVDGLKEAPTPFLSRMTWFLYSIINSSNLLATAWFWAVSYDSHTYAVDMVAHVVISVFVVANILISNMPSRLLHVVYPVIYTALYVLFTFAYHEAGGSGDPIYKELDWSEAYPTAVTVMVGLMVVVPLLHAVTFALYTFRLYLHAKANSASFTPRELWSSGGQGEGGGCAVTWARNGSNNDDKNGGESTASASNVKIESTVS